ncbi:hypothetical protein Tco_0053070 [Tanacetum coccineum]
MRFHPRVPLKIPAASLYVILTESICSGGGGTDGGSDGESGQDLLRDKDGSFDESSGYHILDSIGAIPSKTAADAKVAIKEMVEYFQNGIMEHLEEEVLRLLTDWLLYKHN